MIVSLTGLHYVCHHSFSVVVLLKALRSYLDRMIEYQDSSKSLGVIDPDVLEL
jgi:hypothetical protein